MKNNIYGIFVGANLNIKDHNKLREYISFCIDNNQKSHTKFETSHHHILPQAEKLPFAKYSDLKEIMWNGTYLTHQNHYKAHFMLACAVADDSILYAWNSMKNKDSVRFNISIEDDSNEYHELITEYRKLASTIVTVFDEFGNTFNVKKTDSRYLSGELQSVGRLRGSVKGENNPAYGKVWIHYCGEDKFIDLEDLEEYEILGWLKGYSTQKRTKHSKALKGHKKSKGSSKNYSIAKSNTTQIHYKDINKQVKNNVLIYYLVDGWTIGVSDKTKQKNSDSNGGKNHYSFGKTWMNNNTERKLVFNSDVTSYLELGWVKGRIIH